MIAKGSKGMVVSYVVLAVSIATSVVVFSSDKLASIPYAVIAGICSLLLCLGVLWTRKIEVNEEYMIAHHACWKKKIPLTEIERIEQYKVSCVVFRLNDAPLALNIGAIAAEDYPAFVSYLQERIAQ